MKTLIDAPDPGEICPVCDLPYLEHTSGSMMGCMSIIEHKEEVAQEEELRRKQAAMQMKIDMHVEPIRYSVTAKTPEQTEKMKRLVEGPTVEELKETRNVVSVEIGWWDSDDVSKEEIQELIDNSVSTLLLRMIRSKAKHAHIYSYGGEKKDADPRQVN